MKEIKVILSARKSIEIFDHKLWMRKNTPNFFDTIMGDLRAAQPTDAVGIYMFGMIHLEFPDFMRGINRDDVLLLVKTYSNRRLQLMKKKLHSSNALVLP